ncbi:aminotransferase class I/II-fold pyridoxal phosphate-dependent enzyme [Ancylomarina euxinus]|uniref:Aminotransferase n=1 Tax=Ancylomarina euxinus TaxID=2283627 RepID=A0A425Y836_9BACT|nr:aminotransferase class I/II-fold pyridoxal phosphate-dependent enzyme [Ancylomarina euxinus]MCZ4693451.1 aminotransferase class I/II-fold pyridoxal phosphate-dependent enzyme [Ancylomarina euxinus]MUP13678.1 aminotransferase class I/II-fold pyridoxal phosphate-dependent enzyme [Ancylomarina euxinus]RRG24681.1 aminotransferase class I/II-fold pyridoxal phosphate-dependent enzyme [Ancylomarina euxinus]
MQAIILAAGLGKRLGNLTQNNTKCMVEIHGKTLIERSLDNLSEAGISRVILVIGYEGQKVIDLLGNSYANMELVYVENPIYNKTNNIYSLYLAKDYLTDRDTILLESDLIYDAEILNKLIAADAPNLAVVAKYESWMDGTVVTLDENNNILNFIPKTHFDYQQLHNYYKTVNIYKLSKDFSSSHYVPFLEAYCKALGHNEYYEQVLRVITLLENSDLKAYKIDTEKWYEIDDIQDYNNAETVFAPASEKLKMIQARYGGYWRFPYLKDFCYLVNPYFPGIKMENEIKAYFHALMSEYPSGLNVQNLLAARMFDCPQDQIVVGNGAAELINALSSVLKGKVGIINPSFNEYAERFEALGLETFVPGNEHFSYSLSDLKSFSQSVEQLLLINPDNPSGHFIPVNEVLELAQFLADANKKLILDESFIDFSSEGPKNTLIKEEVLMAYPNLIIIKSISKSYGVPGFRLGVLTCSDLNLMKKVKSKISIWNVNSFGEFFMQIFEKYRKDYFKACNTISTERDRFYTLLNNIEYLRVIPSQANYFLCELVNGQSSSELTEKLLVEHDLFIKDLKGKKGFENKEYIRIAVRDGKDNDFIVDILKNRVW